MHPFFLSSFQTEEKGRGKKGRVIEPVTAWRVQQKCNIFRRASFSFPHAKKSIRRKTQFLLPCGGEYTPYISGPGNALSRKNKADRSNSRKKSRYGINHVAIHLGFAMKLSTSFFCSENLANFHCYRRNLASSALSSSCCVPPPASHPTPIYESSCCILTHSPFPPPRIAFSPLHSRREEGPLSRTTQTRLLLKKRFI